MQKNREGLARRWAREGKGRRGFKAKVDEGLGKEGEMSVSRREVLQKWIKAGEAADMPAGKGGGGGGKGEGVVIIRPDT